MPVHFGNHSQSHDSCELLVRDDPRGRGTFCVSPVPCTPRRSTVRRAHVYILGGAGNAGSNAQCG
eukprot:3617342-Prymnesium_polylepis.1